jgi:transcriptional regulator with XRE-family HTH domain
VGYRGKTHEQNRARDLRALGWTYNEITAELGVSKASVSLWCRDVEMDEAAWAARVRGRRNHGWAKRREGYERRWAAEADADRREAERLLGPFCDRDLYVAGIALYAGEGSKTGGSVSFPNSDPRMIALFLSFLRRFFTVDESRLRVRLYLHEGLDLAAATAYWSELMQIPVEQFRKPYRAAPDPSIRKAKHPMGCPSVRYSCTTTHRTLMALVGALLSSTSHNPG